MNPDLVVIGGGATGIGAARAARARGASVALVERAMIGGDCTFTGCIPSKTLIESVGRGENFAAAMDAVRSAVERVAATEDASVLREEGIEVIEGQARFTAPATLDVDGTVVRASAVVIATGASPFVPPIPGLDTVEYLTNETVFGLSSMPESLTVLGGGPIGVELAHAFSRLGCRVTVIEGAVRLLPREEPLASEVLTSVIQRCGVTVRTGSSVVRVGAQGSGAGVRAHLADKTSIDSEALLVAVGRTPATAGLGLDAAGVELTEGGFVRVDDRLRTTARSVFAAGDVCQHLQFTHVAYATGRIAALNALSRLPWRRFRSGAVPWVTFTSPEIARVGMTEAQAVKHGGQVAFLPLCEVDRAITAGRTEGFVKVIAGPRPVLRNLAGGRILGATIVAPRAGEMVHELVLAMRVGLFPARVATTIHAYPTWSMAVQQASAQFFGTFGGRTARPAGDESPADEYRSAMGGQLP